MKKHILLVGLLSAHYAAATPQEQNLVTLTKSEYNVAGSFSALFLKPGCSTMHYAAEAIPLPLPSPQWNIYDIHPGYHFGFDLGLKISRCNQGMALLINWERFSASSCASVSVAADNMVGPFFAIGPDTKLYNSAKGNASFNFNEVTIDVGQTVQWGERLQTLLFGGVSITNIKHRLTSYYSNMDGTVTRTILTPQKFQGAGPQFGASFSYNVADDIFYVNGKGSCSLLSGNLKNHTEYLSVSPELALPGINITPPNKQSTSVQRRSQIIPAFAQKLGVAWAIRCKGDFIAQLELGYQSQVYLGALQSVDMGSQVVTPPVSAQSVGVFARTFQRNSSNFSLGGPYFTVDIRF